MRVWPGPERPEKGVVHGVRPRAKGEQPRGRNVGASRVMSGQRGDRPDIRASTVVLVVIPGVVAEDSPVVAVLEDHDRADRRCDPSGPDKVMLVDVRVVADLLRGDTALTWPELTEREPVLLAQPPVRPIEKDQHGAQRFVTHVGD